MNKIALNLERFVIGIESHNRANPAHNVLGLGLNIYDIERLGLDIGEEILPGIPIVDDEKLAGSFRIICDGSHTNEIEQESEVRDLDLVGAEY